jgi:hypothetical protein
VADDVRAGGRTRAERLSEPRTIHPDNWAAMLRLLAMPKRARNGPKPWRLVYTMAQANADLPKGDPNKITREDWNIARWAGEIASAMSRNPPPGADCLWQQGCEERRDEARALAAKLAALLPPED